MLKLSNTILPHTGERILFAGAELSQANSAMIMIHGRGAYAESILELSKEFYSDSIIYIAPQADNFTWYPYRFIEERELNEPGISSGIKLIDDIINQIKNYGIAKENIYLLGFSQGACLVAEYFARNPQKFGGLFILSGGLIGKNLKSSDYVGDSEETPVFLGCSDDDFHIPLERVDESAEIFKKLKADVTKIIYKNIGHTIIKDETAFINEILSQKIAAPSIEQKTKAQ